MKSTKASYATVMALLLAVTTALAHDTWLLPKRFVIAPGTPVTFDLTSGMTFPLLTTAIKPERVEQARYRLAGQTVDLATPRSAQKSLQFSAGLKEAGIATVWVDLKPRQLDLKLSLVQEYLDEIGASTELRRTWANSNPKRWREEYRKHAKTFVSVSGASDDRSWAEPVGMALEIVPEKDPTTLRLGDELPVRVLKQGRPLADFPVGLVRAGEKEGILQKTDAEGRVRFQLSKSGRWLLRGTELRKSAKPGLEWESDFTTLTVEAH